VKRGGEGERKEGTEEKKGGRNERDGRE